MNSAGSGALPPAAQVLQDALTQMKTTQAEQLAALEQRLDTMREQTLQPMLAAKAAIAGGANTLQQRMKVIAMAIVVDNDFATRTHEEAIEILNKTGQQTE